MEDLLQITKLKTTNNYYKFLIKFCIEWVWFGQLIHVLYTNVSFQLLQERFPLSSNEIENANTTFKVVKVKVNNFFNTVTVKLWDFSIHGTSLRLVSWVVSCTGSIKIGGVQTSCAVKFLILINIHNYLFHLLIVSCGCKNLLWIYLK